ncbi:MAG: antibiotic biosynthesis monooxygenase [Rothia sp. (in: high G+C Gram-positive bacteria)]|nr:antibiotic biosynthesis monooxygenase [Rothia sp. (in: high G+C Gram-positive bacteria)]
MFTTSTEPPYVAVIFSSLRPTGHQAQKDGYNAVALRMDQLASEQPGYLGIESARDENGFGITVSYWKDEESAKAWKQVQEHLAAQKSGQKIWYEKYSVHIATVTRAYDFTKT